MTPVNDQERGSHLAAVSAEGADPLAPQRSMLPPMSKLRLAMVGVCIVTVALCAIALAGGFSSSATGSVEGTLGSCGGPHGADNCGSGGLTGTVSFVPVGASSPVCHTQAVDGRWRIALPPGRYDVSATSHEMGGVTGFSHPDPVTVRASQVVRDVRVVFQIR